ncbi:hypothetical protein JOM56_014820 [Amanita muscaria]
MSTAPVGGRRDKRQPVPSSHLTSNSNAAQPALTLHRQSIAFAQAKKAAEADKEDQQQQDDGDGLQSTLSTVSGLSVPSRPITPTTVSRASSTVPPAPSATHSSDSEHSSLTSTTARKIGNKKRKRMGKSGSTKEYKFEDASSDERSKDNGKAHQSEEPIVQVCILLS